MPNLVAGAPACGPSKLPVTVARFAMGFVGWTGMNDRGGVGECTGGRLTRGSGVGRGLPGPECTSCVTLVVAIQGEWGL